MTSLRVTEHSMLEGLQYLLRHFSCNTMITGGNSAIPRVGRESAREKITMPQRRHNTADA